MMDPITLILTALVTGAAKAAGDVAPDVYNGLKALIQKKFAGKPASEAALTEYEKNPKDWEGALKASLVQSDADKDQEVINAAKKLLEILEPEKAATGMFNVDIKDSKVGNVGPNHGRIDVS